MLLIATSAAFVGFVHSLAPGHWLPVVLTAKAHRWPLRRASLGALALAAGHVLISMFIGLITIALGKQIFHGSEEELERYASLMLMIFGLGYAVISYFRHSRCHGHEHHGPDPSGPKGRKAPMLFLFTIGLFPCIAVLPVFLAAAALGAPAVGLSMIAFAIGVAASLSGSTALVSLGLLKLDHPIFEHHGDVITGLSVAAIGLILYLIPV